MYVNLMRQLWLLLAIILLPLSAVGQRVSYGDMRLSVGGRSLLTSWEAYESSTMNPNRSLEKKLSFSNDRH